MGKRTPLSITASEFGYPILLDLNSNNLYNRRINRIIKTVPKKLKASCEICLREVIKESLTNGINIKFEIR